MARTGGIRFASDVTLERGLTRLLLGSWIRKKGKGKKWGKCEHYYINIAASFADFPKKVFINSKFANLIYN